jgi:hypothetical protein
MDRALEFQISCFWSTSIIGALYVYFLGISNDSSFFEFDARYAKIGRAILKWSNFAAKYARLGQVRLASPCSKPPLQLHDLYTAFEIQERFGSA